jgi:hypothetical protein
MAYMKTYYKPTQMRGKRVIYRSIDPAERKRSAAMRWVWFGVVLGASIIDWLIRQ